MAFETSKDPSPLSQEVEERLNALSPVAFDLRDESRAHASHKEGGSGAHLRVRIISQRFHGLSRVARHRLVYATLGPLMQTRIHALAVTALTPDEAIRPTTGTHPTDEN